MLENENFTFDKSKGIILYGAASIGLLSYEALVSLGYNIVCYIDKRADDIRSFQGLPVYRINDSVLDEMKNDNYVVYVSVKNVFEHTNIANLLIEAGFENILYMPLSAINGLGNDRQNKLYKKCELALQNKYDDIGCCPKSKEPDMYEPDNRSLIAQNEDTVTAFISIEQLHTDKKDRATPWFDKSILCLLPHIGLFRFINGESGYSPDRYMDFCVASAAGSNIEVSESWRQNVIKNRSMIYEHMSHSMELESDFFSRNAPNVFYEDGVFNLNSGKHRAAFFASLKRKYIPVKVQKDSYKEFINESCVHTLSEYLKQNHIFVLDAPIPHPYFFDYPCDSKEFYYRLLDKLMYCLADKRYIDHKDIDLSKYKVYCRLKDYGFIERTLTQSKVNVIADICDEQKMLVNLIDDLLYSKHATCVGSDAEDFDYILIDNLDDSISFQEIKKIVISNLKFDGYVLIFSYSVTILDSAPIESTHSVTTWFSSIMNGRAVYVHMIYRKE